MVLSQTKNSELSLQQKISQKLNNNIEDIELVDLLNEYSESLRLHRQNFIKSLEYSDIAKLVAKKLNYEAGLAWSNLNIGSCLIYMDQSDEPNKILTKSLQIFRELKDTRGEAHTLMLLGAAKLSANDFIYANDLIEQGLNLSSLTNYHKGEVIGYYLLANLYDRLGDDQTVVKYCLKGMEIRSDFNLDGRFQTIIGSALLEQSDIVQAKKYLMKVFDDSTLCQDNFSMSQILVKLGKIALIEKEKTKAIDHFQKGLELTREIGLIEQLVLTLEEVSNTFMKYNEPALAEEFLDNFRSQYRLEAHPEKLAGVLLNTSLVKLKLNQIDEALDLLEESWEIIRAGDNAKYKYKCQKAISDIYKAKGDFEKAYKYLKASHKHKSASEKDKKEKQIKILTNKMKVESQRDLKQLALIKNSHLAQVIYEVHEKENALSKAVTTISSLKSETKKFQNITADCIHCSSIGA